MSKKISKNEIVVKSEALPENTLSSQALASLANYDMAAFEGVELDITDNKELFKNDIVIPKIRLVQAMSEARKEKLADEGQMIDSRTNELLLDVDGEMLPIIVLKTFKRWQTFKLVKEKNNVKKVFVSSEIMVLGKNESLPYQFTAEGEEHVRRQVISAYVLLGLDAQKGVAKPYILDFASTSKGAGRDLVSDIKTLNAKKMPAWVGWFKLGKKLVKDEHDYYVKTCRFGGLLPETMLAFLKDAYVDVVSMLDSNTIEIDDSDVNEAAVTEKIEDAKVVSKIKSSSARV